MKKPLQIWGTLILFLFLFPVIVSKIPGEMATTRSKLVKEPSFMVYAANIMEEETLELAEAPESVETETPVAPKSPKAGEGKALLYFTHTNEAFKPVTMANDGKIAVSHHSENITKFGEKLQNQLIFNGIQTDILAVNNAEEMGKRRIPHFRAYKAIRPYVEKRINEQNYDLIMDIHRDAVGPDVTTLVHEGEKYAKVAFVIGLDHPNYQQNLAKAQLIKDEMEKLVPGITRNLIKKGSAHGDGKYNQDLHPSLLVVELGGTGNAEDELNRTVAVIGKAAAGVLGGE
ncbi:stage II sporulation protein P [Sporosarcina limicola]|uniref:Stage II sporulation protein P n=1 Tax=Sporosarcina limicola TaxID=34101 RepID=A0A927MNW4_9BACL|nr:stage II sporulation protein P [Sporosarcina limicola]MBE1554651.1 stage II sporulation protein P [Sporosarcina limicola]